MLIVVRVIRGFLKLISNELYGCSVGLQLYLQPFLHYYSTKFVRVLD